MTYLFEVMPIATQLVLFLGWDSLAENGNTVYHGALNSRCLMNQGVSTFFHFRNVSIEVTNCLLGHLCLLKTNLLICFLKILKVYKYPETETESTFSRHNQSWLGKGKIHLNPSFVRDEGWKGSQLAAVCLGERMEKEACLWWRRGTFSP